MLPNNVVQKKYFFSRIFVSVLLLIITSILLAQLKITSINCTVQNQPCTEETTRILQKLIGKSIFFTNIEKELNNSQNTSGITIEKIGRELPSTLHIQVKTEPVLYSLESKDSNAKFSISNKGYIFPFVESSNNPTVIVNNAETLISGSSVDEKAHQLISQIISIQVQGSFLKSIEYLSSNEIKLQYSELPILIVADPIPVSTLQHLDAIMYTVENTQLSTTSADVKPKQPNIKEIDLRFSLPVLRTE